jgi:hypothetical protein
MSRTFHSGERRLRVRAIRKDKPDLRRLARALIALAEAQAEADAQQDDRSQPNRDRPAPRGSGS